MTFAELLALGVALAMDAMAASVMLGLRVGRPRFRDMLIVGAVFGGFQALMPALGYWLGSSLYRFLEAIDHWVAFALLAVLGARMILDARSSGDTLPDVCDARPLTLRTLLPLAIATSIDALTVGVTLALDSAQIAQAVAVIGVVTALLCMVALRLGSRLGQRFCGRAQITGGAVLIAMGINILLQHLL